MQRNDGLGEAGKEPFGLPVACFLIALAGFVDAIGFIRFHGLYVSFMSGNTTVMGVMVARSNWPGAAVPAGILLSFFTGVTGGELMGGSAWRYRKTWVLLLVATLLTMVANLPDDPFLGSCWMLAGAMGVQNASLQRVGGVNVGLTYVTGSLVHLGRSVAGAVLGRNSWTKAIPFAFLWVSMLSGTVGGGIAAAQSIVGATATAALAATTLAGAAGWLSRPARKTGALQWWS